MGEEAFANEVVARVRALSGASIFRGTPGHELLPVAAACHHADYAAGATLFRAGDPGDALYVVLAGTVAIVRDGHTLVELSPGACFGEVALVDSSTRTAGARAATPAACLVLTAERFRAILNSNGAIGLRVMRVLARRLRDATEREAALHQA